MGTLDKYWLIHVHILFPLTNSYALILLLIDLGIKIKIKIKIKIPMSVQYNCSECIETGLHRQITPPLYLYT